LLDEVIEIFRPTPIVLRLEIKCWPDRVPYPGHPEKVIAALKQAQVLEVFMVVAIIYLVMTTGWDFVQRRIEAHYGKAYGAAAEQQLARDDH